MVRQYLRSRVENSQEMDDLVQETYKTALERWDMLQSHPNPCGWLLLTAKHMWRKVQRYTYTCAEPCDVENIFYEEPAYEIVVMEELLHSLYGANDEKLARGYFLEGSTVAELAQDMQVSPGNVRTRLYRIRRKLRDEVE
ncbi:MAG: sigma-70 family RNA polymerase sigma factor [Lachnospiraceae bacterium]|nr:sigma-70 family RNA polymerase sigma factor [Lachnospiraceae bacterium]